MLLSPQSVLARGYAIVMKDGAAVTSASALHPGDAVALVLADGRAQATIRSKQTEVQSSEKRREEDDG